MEIASAKLYASEMLARVTDEAIQVYGGMGLMDDLPLARFWRDARVERIWDGTSEIQRHIISRDLLRLLAAEMWDLSRLFQPKSIAVFGGWWAENVVTQCQKNGFEGDIWPVHPTRDDINGIACYRDVADLPAGPDAAFLGSIAMRRLR